jgi:uncharacterized protein YndB with AHSA1/START domain
MTTMTETSVPTQVYRVYIKAEPQAIWDAITKPEWTEKYGYAGLADYDLRPGGQFLMRPGAAMAAYEGVPDVIIDGEVVEADPPRRLVQTWRMLMDPGLAAEGFTRLTYEIGERGEDGVTRLTITHDLAAAPNLAALVRGDSEAEGAGGGWPWVLSDLKTLLETGTAFQG